MDSTLDSNLKDHRTISRLRRVFHDKSTAALSNEFSLLANGAFKNLPGGLSESICDSKSLSLVDFKISVYKNIGTERFNVAEIKELFAYMDTNRNGRLERDEFIRGIRVSIHSTNILKIRLYTMRLQVITIM